MKRVKTSTLTGVWKKLIPTFTDDCERVKTSLEEITADVGPARELELEAKPEDGTELLPSCVKLQQMRSCFSWIRKESSFLR